MVSIRKIKTFSHNTANGHFGIIADGAVIGKPTASTVSIISLNKDKELDIRALSTTITSHLTTPKTRVLSFMHFSDTHGDKEQIDRTIEALNGLGGIDFAINSGDTLVDNFNNSFDDYKTPYYAHRS